MKTKINLLLVAITSIFLVAFSKQNKVNKEPRINTSLLWKIEGNGLKDPSYVFGTMHMIQKEYYYFPSELEKIVKKSNAIVMEISAEELSNQSNAMQFMLLKEGTLLDYFSPEQQDTLLKWVERKLFMKKDAFTAAFSAFKPFVIVQTALQLQFMGKTESYEMKLMELSSKNKIKSIGLETIADQIGIFDKMSKEEQAEMVMQNIRDEEKTAKQLTEMQGIYFRQQLDSLYLMTNDGGFIEKQEKALLSDRNKNWIPKIKEQLIHGKAFIAVGAAHLAGEEGVLELLRKEGYTVTPVKF